MIIALLCQELYKQEKQFLLHRAHCFVKTVFAAFLSGKGKDNKKSTIHKTIGNPSPSGAKTIKWHCFTGITAESRGFEESKYDAFGFPMDRSTQVVGSIRERIAKVEQC